MAAQATGLLVASILALIAIHVLHVLSQLQQLKTDGLLLIQFVAHSLTGAALLADFATTRVLCVAAGPGTNFLA